MASVIISLLAVFILFALVAHSWFVACFEKGLGIPVKDFRFAVFFTTILFCVILCIFNAGILLLMGLVIMSIFPGIFLNAFNDLVAATVLLTSAILLIFSYSLHRSMKRIEKEAKLNREATQ